MQAQSDVILMREKFTYLCGQFEEFIREYDYETKESDLKKEIIDRQAAEAKLGQSLTKIKTLEVQLHELTHGKTVREKELEGKLQDVTHIKYTKECEIDDLKSAIKTEIKS